MAPEDVALITRFYEKHLSREGHPQLVEGSGHVDDSMAEDVVIENFDEAPVTTPYRGHEGVRRWARANADTIDNIWFELLDAADVGDGWLALRVHIRGQIHGIESTFVFHPITHVSDGRWDYAKGFLREEDALGAIDELRRSGVPSP